jgi:hypothetical protein
LVAFRPDLRSHTESRMENELMAKRKKPTAKPNKSAFVRSLAFDMPSAEVIAKAKAKGMTLTRNDVHAIRAIARRKQKPGKEAGSAPRGATRAGTINKSAFVRSLPGNLSAAEVISRARGQGIKLSAAQVYTIRANARRKAEDSPRTALSRGSQAVLRVTNFSGGGGNENDFVRMALDLGLVRAETILSSLRNRAAAGLG